MTDAGREGMLVFVLAGAGAAGGVIIAHDVVHGPYRAPTLGVSMIGATLGALAGASIRLPALGRLAEAGAQKPGGLSGVSERWFP